MQDNFEAKVKKLEEIVGQIESGKTDLSESIKLFEEGMTLSKECQAALDAADEKIKILMSDGSEEKLEDFDA